MERRYLNNGWSVVLVMMHSHNVHPPMDVSPAQRVAYLDTYLADVRTRLDAHQEQQDEWRELRHKLEEDVRTSLDKRELLSRELEGTRKEREEIREKVQLLEARIKVSCAMVLCKC